ncbi:MAG: hypothetical protein DRQ01_01360 [Ignavibacteriae bacterium]|nr:MAG: hypothetical protein DRQ01_01360 [Ignavibacteriota bacterium]
MKKLLLITFSLLLSVNVFAQYPEITIMDIQWQDLTLGDTSSVYTGDTVTVVGVVMVAPFRDANPDSGTTLIAGAPAIILQDTSETDFGGILTRFPGSNATFNVIDTGYIIRATGVVIEYFKTTELDLISFEGSDVLGFMQRPQPVSVTLDSLTELGGRQGKFSAERWESVFIRVDTVTATTGGVGTGSYEVFDENNTQVIVGNQSSYFRNSATVPTPGTLINVTGYIQNRDNVPNTTYAHLINPTYPGDVEVLLFVPSISNITRNPAIVGYGDPVTVTATIVDPDGTVAEAKLIYRKNMGVHNELLMTNPSGDLWNATIPAQNDSSIIDYFVRAVDNENNVSIFPSDTSRNRFFYLVLDRPLTIQDVQFSPFGSGFSGYNGYQGTGRGIVTADTSDIEGDGNLTGPQVYIQNGTGPWSGISVFGTEAQSSFRGDDISVTGPVIESNSVTQIGTTSDPAVVTTLGTGQTLPDPEEITTDEIDDLNNGAVQAEQWEGVLVKYVDVEVSDENADGLPGPDEGSGGNRNFGELLVRDAVSVHETRVELQDGTHQYHNFWAVELENEPIRIREGDTFDELIGILWYSFGNYKLLPRKDDDFVGHTTDVNDEIEIPNDFTLSQNYPNPFNPSTKIQYALPVTGNVTLKVYNILGQEVMTLINNQSQTPGLHEVTFNASSLPSGIYLYRLQAENFVDAKKMILLK